MLGFVKNETRYFGGYCVINAMRNLLNSYGFDFSLEDIQEKAKYCVSVFDTLSVEEAKKFFNEYNNELGYNGLYRSRKKYVESSKAEKLLDFYKKFYKKRTRKSCMNGNACWLSYALLKSMGYRVVGIQKFIDMDGLEQLHKKYGNFIFAISGHESSVINGNIVDFFNPFIKHEWRKKEDELIRSENPNWELAELPKRRRVEYIIVKA